MEREKSGFQTLLESVERRIFGYVAQIDHCVKRDIKEGDVVLDLIDRTNKLEWPIRIVHEALKARAPGEKEPKVRSVWLRHPIPSHLVTDDGKHRTQHKYTKRGIEQISLLEEALEETTP